MILQGTLAGKVAQLRFATEATASYRQSFAYHLHGRGHDKSMLRRQN